MLCLRAHREAFEAAVAHEGHLASNGAQNNALERAAGMQRLRLRAADGSAHELTVRRLMLPSPMRGP